MRFNREGNLLAVTTADNGFKILANAVGVKTLKLMESTTSFEGLRPPIESTVIKVLIIYLVVFLLSFFFFITSSRPYYLCLNRHLARRLLQMLVRSIVKWKGALLLGLHQFLYVS